PATTSFGRKDQVRTRFQRESLILSWQFPHEQAGVRKLTTRQRGACMAGELRAKAMPGIVRRSQAEFGARQFRWHPVQVLTRRSAGNSLRSYPDEAVASWRTFRAMSHSEDGTGSRASSATAINANRID